MAENFYCGHCAQNALRQNPAAFGRNNSIQLISLLERGIPAICPACGPIYTVAKIVANSPQFPKEIRDVAATLCAMFLVLAGAHFVDRLLTKAT